MGVSSLLFLLGGCTGVQFVLQRGTREVFLCPVPLSRGLDACAHHFLLTWVLGTDSHKAWGRLKSRGTGEAVVVGLGSELCCCINLFGVCNPGHCMTKSQEDHEV